MPINLTLIFIFCFIGVLDTGYLIYHKVKGTSARCLFFPKEWCEKVQYSSYSSTFGVPNSIAGLFIYIGIALLTVLYLQGLAPFYLVQAVIAMGFAFSLYFTFIQAFVLKAFCTWCVVSAIIFLVMFGVAFLM